MNTKQLTQHTLHSIEEALASQGIALTTQGKHRLEDILQDHNTAYKSRLIAAIESVAIEVLHTKPVVTSRYDNS